MGEIGNLSVVREFARFGKAWLKTALGGVWGKIGDTATFLGLVVPAISSQDPAWWHKVILFLHVSGNEALLWEAPVGLGGSILLVRLILAPFWIMHSERTEMKATLDSQTKALDELRSAHAEEIAKQRAGSEATTERLERRIAELETPSPRIVIEVTEDTERPFLLKNVGPVEAHGVRILPIRESVWTVEFETVDTIYTRAAFAPRLTISRSDEEVGMLFGGRFEYFLKGVRETKISELMDTVTDEPVTPSFEARIEAAFEDMRSSRPMVIEYSDDNGRRTFRTEYNYRANALGSNLSVEFVRRYAVEREVASVLAIEPRNG